MEPSLDSPPPTHARFHTLGIHAQVPGVLRYYCGNHGVGHNNLRADLGSWLGMVLGSVGGEVCRLRMPEMHIEREFAEGSVSFWNKTKQNQLLVQCTNTASLLTFIILAITKDFHMRPFLE